VKHLLLVALFATTAFADDFEDLGACQEQVFHLSDKTPVRTTTYERDAKKRIVKATTKTSSMAIVQTRTYDDKGRLAIVAFSDISIANEYDAKTGRLARTIETTRGQKDPSRIWMREYDDKGHLAHETAKEGDKVTIDKRYTYDDKGRIATMKMDGGATSETHTYDAAGHLVRNDVVVSQQKIPFTYAYDNKGRRMSQTNPNGRIEYSYDCR
jgi:YD repeat-containing protein